MSGQCSMFSRSGTGRSVGGVREQRAASPSNSKRLRSPKRNDNGSTENDKGNRKKEHRRQKSVEQRVNDYEKLTTGNVPAAKRRGRSRQVQPNINAVAAADPDVREDVSPLSPEAPSTTVSMADSISGNGDGCVPTTAEESPTNKKSRERRRARSARSRPNERGGSVSPRNAGPSVFDRLSKSYTESYTRQLAESEMERNRSKSRRRDRYSARVNRPERRPLPEDLGDEVPAPKSEEEIQANERAREEAAAIFDRLSKTNTASSAQRRRNQPARVPQVRRNFVGGKVNTGYQNSTNPTVSSPRDNYRVYDSNGTDEASSIFERLSHATTESLQKKRSEKRQIETKRNFVSGVVRRSQSDATVARELSPRESRVRSRSRPLSGGNVYERLTSREAMTGVTRRLHADKSRLRLARSRRISRSSFDGPNSPGGRSRGRRQPSISSAQSDGTVIRNRKGMAQVELLQDLVTVLTDPKPHENREELISGLKQRLDVEHINRPSHPKWKACLHRILLRHLRAQKRDTENPDCKTLVASSSPSARGMCSMLASSMGERLDQQLGEIFRIKVLGESLLIVRANRHSMNTAAINRHFFGDDQRVLLKHGCSIYCLTIGERKFIGSVAAGHTVASRVSAHIRAAFFSGTDAPESFELSQALRVTPVDQWRGEVIESFVKAAPADLEMATQAAVFEHRAYWPFGLNTSVNEKLRQLMVDKDSSTTKSDRPPIEVVRDDVDQGLVSDVEDNDDRFEPSISHMDQAHRMPSFDNIESSEVSMPSPFSTEVRELTQDDIESVQRSSRNTKETNDDDQQHGAATSIQAAYRGYSTRKKHSSAMKENAAAAQEENTQYAVDEDESTLNDDNVVVQEESTYTVDEDESTLKDDYDADESTLKDDYDEDESTLKDEYDEDESTLKDDYDDDEYDGAAVNADDYETF